MDFYLINESRLLSDLEIAGAVGSSMPSKAGPQDKYGIIGGVAIIPITGILLGRHSFRPFFSENTDPSDSITNISRAIDSENVCAIVLNIDSPGGSMFGIPDLFEKIFKGRSKKPVVAISEGEMAGSAYWIGAASNKIILSPCARAGGLGVCAVHEDRSGADSKIGIKRTVLASGKYKAVGNPAESLSEAGLGYLQGQVNYIRDLAIDEVRKGRGWGFKKISDDIKNGRTFIGKQAVDVGLADAIGTLQDAIQLAKAMAEKPPYVSVTAESPKPPVISIVFPEKPEVKPTPPQTSVPKIDQTVIHPSFMGLVNQYQARKKCRRTDALLAVAVLHPEAHKRFLNDLSMSKQKGI